MIDFFLYLSIFIFGLLVGSFLNCVIYRLETEKSFLKGRSFCPHCKTTLEWFDLIPVLSFFWLRGQCRYCGEKISWQYPLVELATALLFTQIFTFQISTSNQIFIIQTLNIIYYLTIAAFLIIIFVYDLKHYIIPDKVIYPAIVIALIFILQFAIFNQFTFLSAFGGEIFTEANIFQSSILSAFGAALFFLAVVLITKGKGMGIGDIKLAFLMGLILGWPNILVALFLAFFLGAVSGIFLILFKRKTMKSEVPFAPFLIIGLFLSLFFGDRIINWYLSFFLLK